MKITRLIGLGLAIHAGPHGCSKGRMKVAVEAGATKDGVLEAISVAIAMSGNPVTVRQGSVVKILEELGKW